jgi:hypothetical protein
MGYDPGLLARLGFPGHTERICAHFLKAVASDRRGIAPGDIGHTVRALSRIPRVLPALADRADGIRSRLTSHEYLPGTSTRSEPPRRLAPQTGNLDVQRVLADL